MKKCILEILVLAFLVTTSLQAQLIPGRWEQLDRQPTGKRIIVTLKSGDRLECALKESGADDLTVITSTGSELKVAKSEVPLGFAIGVIGAGVGDAVGYLLDKKRKGSEMLYQTP